MKLTTSVMLNTMTTPAIHSVSTPWITPFRPGPGWATATTSRRLATAAAAPVLALTLALSALDNVAVQLLVILVQLSLGSTCYYAVARVLRPSTAPSIERTARHACAAVATAAASWFAAAAWVLTPSGLLGDVAILPIWGLGAVAYVLIPLSVVWGVVAVLVRLRRD